MKSSANSNRQRCLTGRWRKGATIKRRPTGAKAVSDTENRTQRQVNMKYTVRVSSLSQHTHLQNHHQKTETVRPMVTKHTAKQRFCGGTFLSSILLLTTCHFCSKRTTLCSVFEPDPESPRPRSISLPLSSS